MNVDFEFLKYLLASIPGTLAFAVQWWRTRKTDKIKDYEDFLLKLEAMHEKVLTAKASIMRLSFENEQLKALNLSLNETINNLEKIIREYKNKFGKI